MAKYVSNASSKVGGGGGGEIVVTRAFARVTRLRPEIKWERISPNGRGGSGRRAETPILRSFGVTNFRPVYGPVLEARWWW